MIDGHFRVDEVAGEGGFSVVYRGFHVGLGETIAIKCLKLPAALGSALVESFMRRFRDEGKLLYRLSQGNLHIVRSIASGITMAPATSALVPYMVLEWLEGVSLAGDLEARQAVRVTFVDDGSVKNASVDAPFDATPEGECAAARFRTAHVPPFQGPPVTVEHPFHIPK